jgi:hypothetical protein
VEGGRAGSGFVYDPNEHVRGLRLLHQHDEEIVIVAADVEVVGADERGAYRRSALGKGVRAAVADTAT